MNSMIIGERNKTIQMIKETQTIISRNDETIKRFKTDKYF